MTAELEIRTGGALAISSEQTEWTEQQLVVLRSAGVSEEVTPGELSAFLHECQRTKLDPFTRQIYLIGRYDNQAKRKVFRSQTGIDGYRVIAHRVVREERAALEYEDALWCGFDGIWHDVWLSDTPPAAAKIVVLKNGKRFPAVATLAEYAARYPDGNPYPMWKRMPSNQLAKCGEALALRKAFPQDLAGIYTAEEMEQADARAEVTVTQGQPQHEVADAVARKAQREMMDIAPRDQRNPIDPDFELPPMPEAPMETRELNWWTGKVAILCASKRGISGGTPEARQARLDVIEQITGLKVASSKELPRQALSKVVDVLTLEPEHIAEAVVVEDAPAGTDDPDQIEADLQAGIEAAPTLGELRDAYERAKAAVAAGAIGSAALGPLAAARVRREDELTADHGWSGGVSRQMDGAAA